MPTTPPTPDHDTNAMPVRPRRAASSVNSTSATPTQPARRVIAEEASTHPRAVTSGTAESLTAPPPDDLSPPGTLSDLSTLYAHTDESLLAISELCTETPPKAPPPAPVTPATIIGTAAEPRSRPVETAAAPAHTPEAPAETASPPAVILRGVTKVFSVATAPLKVLDAVDLVIAPAATITLQGVSGSGKSTLLHIIGAIDKPTAGTVCVNGTELTGLSSSAQARFRATSIGFIFQFFNLLPTLTAAENVATGLEPLGVNRHERALAVAQALEFVGIAAQADKYPAQLSGGQQQRVAIARAIVKRPPLILADEPTGALDSQTSKLVLDCLKSLQAQTGCALVLATHDPIVNEYADQTYRLADGRLVWES